MVKVRVVRTVVKVVKVPVVSTVVKIVRVMVAAPTVTPTVVAPDAVLIRTSGTDNKQTNTFTADGPFTLSWDARKTDTSGLFSVELHSASGQEFDLPVNTTDPGRNITIEHADCSSGCYLKITSDTVTYSIVAQLGTNPTAAAALPTLTPTPPAGLSASVDASDPAVQAVLQFAPACTNVTVNSDSIATRVEQQEGLSTYIGSNSYPGTFTKQGAANGATTVTWHLPSHRSTARTSSRSTGYEPHVVPQRCCVQYQLLTEPEPIGSLVASDEGLW